MERWWGSSPQSLASTFNAWLVLASPDRVADKCQSYHWDLALPLDGRRADSICANEGGRFFDCLIGEENTIWTEISGVITWGQLHQILLKQSFHLIFLVFSHLQDSFRKQNCILSSNRIPPAPPVKAVSTTQHEDHRRCRRETHLLWPRRNGKLPFVDPLPDTSTGRSRSTRANSRFSGRPSQWAYRDNVLDAEGSPILRRGSSFWSLNSSNESEGRRGSMANILNVFRRNS